MFKRGSGVLMHISSFPSPYGIGDLGPGAYLFADFLNKAKQSYWQFLPINPTNQAMGNSPYSSISAFAGNKLFISPERLIQEGLLQKKDVTAEIKAPEHRCDYQNAALYKEKLFNKAYERFSIKKDKSQFEEFCSNNSLWLDNFVIFSVLRNSFKGASWNTWDEALRDRKKERLEEVKKKYKKELDKERFLQYIFFKQYFELKAYCNEKGVNLIGDVPIYVSYDSSDVWANTDIFKLDSRKNPTHLAGVPPDYFSNKGQLWGNPVYRWDILENTGFEWWVNRLRHDFSLFDIVRIDHFRGFVAYWDVPSGEKTAINGKWVKAPADNFFSALQKNFPSLPIIAEDLGYITDDVREIVNKYKFPGMKVLLFAFGDEDNMHPYMPHTYGKNLVVYTGTHDNNTIQGWFKHEARHRDKERLFRYIGKKVPLKEVHWEIMRLATASVADICIFPLQDILGLDEKARMNIPSVSKGNWEWRMARGELDRAVVDRLLEMTVTYGRC